METTERNTKANSNGLHAEEISSALTGVKVNRQASLDYDEIPVEICNISEVKSCQHTWKDGRYGQITIPWWQVCMMKLEALDGKKFHMVVQGEVTQVFEIDTTNLIVERNHYTWVELAET